MLFAIFLIIVVPLTVTFWLVSLIAPWWVAAPFAALVSLVVFLLTVKFKK